MDIDLISLSSFSFPSENKLFVTLRVNGEIVDDARYDIGIYTKRRSKTTGMGDVAPITPLYLIMDGRGMDIRFPEAVVAYQNRGIEATRYGNEGEEIGGVEIEGIGTDTLIFSIPLEPFGDKELYWISASARGEKGSDFCSGTTRISYCAPLFSLFGILGLVAIALWHFSKRILAIFLGFAIPFLAFTSFGYLKEAVALATYPSYRMSEPGLTSGIGTVLGITFGIFGAVIMTIIVAVYTAYKYINNKII